MVKVSLKAQHDVIKYLLMSTTQRQPVYCHAGAKEIHEHRCVLCRGHVHATFQN